ncbi:MAG: ATP-dependent zinc metalloprotease FtsH [Actinobacteria bacterium]|nr:MAG: ATP-dependent zinc metalloprotease FtsH [Actinomycetota bacterium]RIK04740.1 MAG: cell division protein FtsH [Acidobacteriota bacterium]
MVNNKLLKHPLFLVGAVIVVVAAVVFGLTRGEDREELTVDEFESQLEEGHVRTAEVLDQSHKILGELEDGTEYEVSFVAEYGEQLSKELLAADVEFTVDGEQESVFTSLLYSLLPTVLLIGVFLWFISQMQGGGSRLMKFGQARTRKVDKDQPTVTFGDVAGVDEAIEELREIEEFLENPAKFRAVGAKIPKGVLLFGPPGTGKTLLARAVAGEAGAPFFTISGSDFVEMFVGVGASRVRDLFRQAKEAAPAIIFVDEIDAVGRHRGAGVGGGHDEREQTLNQLLVEMDGFDVTSGVIIMAATNRPDILDPALLRPGRFDRQIVIDKPDLKGRTQILGVHAKGKPLADDVDLEIVARRTPGFTGADLANVMNEAALIAARRGDGTIGMSSLTAAVDRVIAGPERKSRVMSDREKRVIAYHEAGHALVGHVLPNTDPIHKISIIARGRALGWTLALPAEDKYLKSRSELLDHLAMLLGGRTAEEIIFGDPTTGAADDIEKATQIARSMVTEFGMSTSLGPQKLGHNEDEPFLGKEHVHQANYSDEVAARIDDEVIRLLDDAHEEAREILTLHRTVLHRLAEGLIRNETLEEDDLNEMFADMGSIDDGGGASSGNGSEPDASGESRDAGRSPQH